MSSAGRVTDDQALLFLFWLVMEKQLVTGGEVVRALPAFQFQYVGR